MKFKLFRSFTIKRSKGETQNISTKFLKRCSDKSKMRPYVKLWSTQQPQDLLTTNSSTCVAWSMFCLAAIRKRTSGLGLCFKYFPIFNQELRRSPWQNFVQFLMFLTRISRLIRLTQMNSMWWSMSMIAIGTW